MRFSVACAQIAPVKADVSKNLDTIAEAILQASGEGVDLVVLPETSTSGYFLEGGVLESSLTTSDLCLELEKRLDGLDRPVDVLVGFYERDRGNLHNSCAYIAVEPKRSHLVGVYRKFFLPTYGVFDEERFVNRGKELGVFDTRLGKIGVLVCEDVWHSVMPSLTALSGAQVILVPAASPGRGFSGDTVENLDRYNRLLRGIAEEHGVWCVNCQLCGFEGGKGFVGGSMVVNPFGKVVAQSPILDPHILITQIDLDEVAVARAQSPLLADLSSAWGDIKRLVDSTE
jgi:predicted amidohydrolase